MKNLLITVATVANLFGFNAFAGDGYASSVDAISVILKDSKVEEAALFHFIQSIKIFGSFTDENITYIVSVADEAIGEAKFCLVVSVEGHLSGKSKVVYVEKFGSNSKLCH